MKKFKNIRLIIFSIAVSCCFSCIKTDDFEIPNIEYNEPEITGNTNIEAIKKAYDQSGENIYTFDSNDQSIIEGFVISSDEAGNFYKLLVIQDDYENSISGIQILIDLKSYYTKFNFGRKLYLKMAGLSMTKESGNYKIGYIIQNQLTNIPSTLIDQSLIRSTITKEIMPKNTLFSEFSDQILNTLVFVENIQFKKNELGKTFAGEPYDQYNAERVIVQCNNLLTTTLSTSTYADFKSNLIPENSGNLNSVFTKDYYGEKYILVLNDPSILNFTNNNRCDPEFLNCDDYNDVESNNILFFENFENIKNTQELEDLGWTNTNIYLGNEKFKKRTKNGNIVMEISGYNTEENPLEVWLITPKINLNQSENEVLTFQTSASYDNGTILTAWVSTDFEKEINNANWQQLDVTISVGPSNANSTEFTISGNINLNCLENDVNIGFKYLGRDPDLTTTYDIDNIKILYK